MTYQQTVNKIHSFLRFGSRPGLGRITKLLQLLGNPHKGLVYFPLCLRFSRAYTDQRLYDPRNTAMRNNSASAAVC